MYFRCGFILDFKWGSFPKNKEVVQKQESRQEKETRPNSVLKKASLHFLKIYFQKKLHGEGK
jgi:hypothetical protein